MSEGDSIFGLMLLAGLAGGLGHCSGMCGPLVILLSPRTAGLGRTVQLHGGRVLSYALLGGGLAGLTSWLALEIEAIPARRLAMLLAGAVLLLSGLATLGLPLLPAGWLQKVVSSGPIRFAAKVASSWGHFALGLLWGLLPCGLLYSAFAAAAGAGAAASSPATAVMRGAAVMLLFGLGTTPTLIGIAWAAKQLPAGLRIWLQRLAGVVVAVTGLLLILHGWRLS
jgi:sulfite exporter TauE/SafE